MKSDIKLIIISAVSIIIFALVTEFLISKQGEPVNQEVGGSWACTTDVFVCPDGSEVGRVPPYCNFSPCSQ